MDFFLNKIRTLDGVDKKSSCLNILCRKCRRELIIHAVLQLLHSHAQFNISDQLASLASYSVKSYKDDNTVFRQNIKENTSRCFLDLKSQYIKENFFQVIKYPMAWLLALERDSSDHYVSIWKNWAMSETLFNQSPSGESLHNQKSSHVPQPRSPKKSSLNPSSSSWLNFFLSLVDQDSRQESLKLLSSSSSFSSSSSSLESNFRAPFTKIAKQFLMNHNIWFPQAASVCCLRCQVWINTETVCHCSLLSECFPCIKSRLKAIDQHTSQRFWNTFYNTCRASKNCSVKKCRRSHSVPAFPKSWSEKTRVEQLEKIFFPCPLKEVEQMNVFPLLVDDLLEIVNSFLTNPSLAFKFVSSPSLTLSIQTILDAEALIPSFIRLLPLTHYVIFLHGFYGTTKDYRKFLDLLLFSFPDVHCFLPDCYANKATVSIALVAEAVRSYLLVYTPQPFGATRLPRSPDLFCSLTYVIYPPDQNDQLNCKLVKLSDSDTTALIRLPGCRYLLGTSQPVVLKSRIFISLIGHSLGGIIARCLVALPELRFDNYIHTVNSLIHEKTDRPYGTLFSFLSSPIQKGSGRKSWTPFKREEKQPNHVSTDILHESVVLLNFATFASPHNGIFENFAGIQVFSYILPAARDLTTASPELLQLASPEMILPLSHFYVLAIYGNSSNDFLVGPLTSLLINPTPLVYDHHDQDRCRSNPPLNAKGTTLHKFPLCVIDACIQAKNSPVELNVHGYIIESQDDDDLLMQERKQETFCPLSYCVHHEGKNIPPQSDPEKIHLNQLKPFSTTRFKKIYRHSRRLSSTFNFTLPLNLKLSAFSDEFFIFLPRTHTQQDTDTDGKVEKESFQKSSLRSVSLNSKQPLHTPGDQESHQTFVPPTEHRETLHTPHSVTPVIHSPLKQHEENQEVSPSFYVRYLCRLNWRRFAVFFKSTLRAHSCITWHGRLDPGNTGKYIIQHFLEKVFIPEILS